MTLIELIDADKPKTFATQRSLAATKKQSQYLTADDSHF
jgi:hypothetical protein